MTCRNDAGFTRPAWHQDPAWKQELLSLINSITGFNALAVASRRLSPSELDEAAKSLSTAARKILAGFDRNLLVRTRHHYNNAQLLAFWLWLIEWLNDAVESYGTRQDFPLFIFNDEPAVDEENLRSFAPEELGQSFYWKVADNPRSYNWCAASSASAERHRWAGYPHDHHEQLFGRLHRLLRMWIAMVTTLYNGFITEQRLLRMPCWDDYRIHLFLSLFLYRTDDGQNSSALFDSIFFSNNICELEAYIRYRQESTPRIQPEEIVDFFCRQRKYYLQLAMKIDLEETVWLNNTHHLLRFDPDIGASVAPELDAKKRELIHQMFVEKAGIGKAEGCPFAQSKGASGNALVEVYSVFDGCMQAVIELWLNEEAGVLDKQAPNDD